MTYAAETIACWYPTAGPPAICGGWLAGICGVCGVCGLGGVVVLGDRGLKGLAFGLNTNSLALGFNLEVDTALDILSTSS